MSAGATSTSLTNPLWVIKTRMMVKWLNIRFIWFHPLTGIVDTKWTYCISIQELIRCIHYHWTSRRIPWLLQGIRTIIARCQPCRSAVSTIWKAQTLFTYVYGCSSFLFVYSRDPCIDADSSSASPVSILLASSLSKMAASMATYPHEVIMILDMA